MTPRTRAKWRIRNTPVVDSKYLPVWKKIRTKLKMKKLLGALTNQIQVFGTTVQVGTSIDGDIEKMIA